MQGTSLTKQKRECKLYDEFDKFAYKKGESLRDFYLRFSLLLNDMNTYNMKLEKFQLNTNFLNTLPPEWSKFVTDVKLVRDLHTTNVDKLHAYLGQHEFHANEVRLMHKCNSDPLALVANHQMTQSPYQMHQQSYKHTQFQPQVSLFQSSQYGSPYQSSHYGSHAQSSTPLSITYPSNDFQSSVHHNVYNPSSSIPQVEYALLVHQQSDFSQPDSSLIVPVFQKGDDLIDAINHMMSFLTTVVTSRVTVQPIQGRQNSLAAGTSRQYTSGPSRNNSRKQRTVACCNCKREGHMSNQSTKQKRKRDEAWFKDKVLLVQAQANGQILHEEELEFLADQGIAEAQTTYVIQKTNAIVIRDSEETLVLEEESRSKMLKKQKDQTMSEKKVNTKPYAALNQLSQDFKIRFVPQTELSVEQVFWSQNFINSEEPNLSTRPTQVEVPKELLKVSMVNSSLKKLKYHLASFDVFEVQNVFNQMEQDVKQHRVELNIFQDKIKEVLNENERLLEQAIRKDIVNIVEKVLVITALKDTLRKLKGKAVVDEAVTLYPIDPELLKIDVAPLAPKLRNNRTVHYDYLKHNQEETANLRELVENERLLNPLNASLDYALGNACPLTRITTTAKVPLRKPIPLESNTSKPVVTLVYSRKPKESRNNVPVSKSKLNKSLSADKKEPNKSWGSIISNVPSSSTVECRLLKLFSGTVKFGNDHVAKIMGYGDYKIENVTISKVYFVEGLGHNLYSVGQFCDSNLEVAFRQYTCFICNLKGVDLLNGSRGKNLYTLSLGDMMASSYICLLSKASRTKSWLWHRRLSHLNFGAINHLARQ
nr:retrovirus-related Pol polyprotein from transposon TNT 1-94 [Tanacetum cinerariifolium]